MSSIDTSTWKKFKLSELFTIKTCKSVDRKNLKFELDGTYDFIGRSSDNYGIQGHVNYLGYEPNQKNTFSLIQIGESKCFFREKEWYASQNIFVLKPTYKEIINIQLYMVTIINKWLEKYKEAYVYPTLNDLQNLEILLPAKEVDVPDWDYMEKYIRVIEKLVIKDVVDWKNEKIQKTKKIVNRSNNRYINEEEE